MDAARLALIAKALAHPARVHIIQLLANQQECSGSELFADLPLAQSTVSQHLRVMKEAGLVASHPVGQGMVYCLDADLVMSFCDEVSSIVADVSPCSLATEECR